MSAGRRQQRRRLPPLAALWVPDVELFDCDEPQEAQERQDDAAVVPDARNGPEEALSGPESDETGSAGVRTAASDRGKPRRPQSRRPPGGWPMVPVPDMSEVRHEPPRRDPPPRSWRSSDDPEMAALLAWQPPAVAERDPLAGAVVLSPVTPGAERPAGLLAYFAALADDTDRTSYAAADAGADDLAAALVRVASWLRAVASLSEPS